jgi:DNA (cytosine-5)-methyltransferase 1
VGDYYNDNEPYVCAWLRNLIAAGHLPAGDVDERSIIDVQADDLNGYRRCHFFAGIGGWAYALELAGWPDDREVWTGSCPCQPFSLAGRGAGMLDERHLWPQWNRLIEQRRPQVIFGEQVEAAIRHGWLDLVQADMEGIGYAFAAAGIPAASVGAPHIRARLWFVAHFDEAGRSEQRGSQLFDRDGKAQWHDSDGRGTANQLGYDKRDGLRECGRTAANEPNESSYWALRDLVRCRDGKWRPVEPGTFPLAHGIPARVGRLRAYGNAIVPQVAQAFIESVMQCRP